MCTVVVSFEPAAAWPVVLLGLRDEQPGRPWDPPGAWWPERGGHVEGIRDREAGGAWLATSSVPTRLAVVLNRREQPEPPVGGFTTRGALPLDAVVQGAPPTGPHTSRTYNLVTADARGVVHASWDGRTRTAGPLASGVHVVTHGAVDDAAVPRVARWAPAFRTAGRPAGPLPAPGEGEGSWRAWLDVLRASARLPVTDAAAIVRSDSHDGAVLRSLSVSLIALSATSVAHAHVRLDPDRSVDEVLAARALGHPRP